MYQFISARDLDLGLNLPSKRFRMARYGYSLLQARRLHDVMWILRAITKYRRSHYPLNIASKSATPLVTPLSQFAIY